MSSTMLSEERLDELERAAIAAERDSEVRELVRGYRDAARERMRADHFEKVVELYRALVPMPKLSGEDRRHHAELKWLADMARIEDLSRALSYAMGMLDALGLRPGDDQMDRLASVRNGGPWMAPKADP